MICTFAQEYCIHPGMCYKHNVQNGKINDMIRNILKFQITMAY